jgi:cytochrome c-type biogenesis protein CcmH
MKKLAIIVCLFCLLPELAYAIDNHPSLANPALQARYERLIHQFRCLVCQDENIANSNADLAADLRNRVRKLVKQGRSDAQIKHYLVARYGDFVLYKPPLQANTWLLWAGPGLMLAIAGMTMGIAVRRRAKFVQAEPETAVNGEAARLEWDREG